MLHQALLHLQDWGIGNIQQYCADLTKSFCEEIKNLGFAVESPRWRAHHLFGIRVREDLSMERLMSAINDANISVSTRGTAIRISPNVYNDAADLDALLHVINQTIKQEAEQRTSVSMP